MQKILRKIALFVLLAILPVTFSGCIAFLDGDSYEDIFNSSKYDLEVQVQLTDVYGDSYYAPLGGLTVEYFMQKEQRTYDDYWGWWRDPSDDALFFSISVPYESPGSRTIVTDAPEGRYYLYFKDIKDFYGNSRMNFVDDDPLYFNLDDDKTVITTIEFLEI